MNIRKNIYPLTSVLILIGLLFSACSENIDDYNNEYANWQPRNEKAFRDTTNVAKHAIATAKKQYGEKWKQHCPWRFYRSYLITENSHASLEDSICVRIVEQSKKTEKPYYTDSVSINYMAQLIPTINYPNGKVCAHSGLTILPEFIFGEETSAPQGMFVKMLIPGMTTALMHMHLGDRWVIHMPAKLAYGEQGNKAIPANSNLKYDVQLVGIYRK